MAGYFDNTNNINENNLNSGGTPINEEQHYAKPTGLFSALSIIQRYYVIEKNSPEDLPKEYFTFEQTFDFFKTGFKSGFIESFILATLLPFFQVIYPSFKYFFFQEKLSNFEKFLLSSISFLPMLVTTLFLIYLSKYYKGAVTKKAVFTLFSGRSFAFIIKGVIVFFIFKYLYYVSYENPNSVYSVLDFIKFIFSFFLPKEIDINTIYQYYYMYIAPALYQTAVEVFVTMGTFALLPFITIFLKGLSEKRKKYSALEAYEKY